MRIAAQVMLAYGVLLMLSALWRFVPLSARPDAVALFAVYLGLTARLQLAPAAFGAFAIGYLGDLLMGTPRGLLAVDAVLVCLFGHLIHRRLIVRGRLFTVIFSAAVAAISAAILMVLRVYVGSGLYPPGEEFAVLGSAALLSGLVGPVLFRLARSVDARFARTHRERTAALEGLIP